MDNRQANELWRLVLDRRWIDPEDFARAAERQIERGDLDYRSRLLIRDGFNALEHYWGKDSLRRRLAGSPAGARIDEIRQESFDEIGFPSIKLRLADKTSMAVFDSVFEKLGGDVSKPTTIDVGGSVSLILQGFLDRRTEDIDIVDEVPQDLRVKHKLLAKIQETTGLQIAHFQSHYLPMRWEKRTTWYGQYDDLTVRLVDPTDIFLSKLVSIREKDLEDMRLVLPKLDRQEILDRFRADCQSWIASESLLDRAVKNWQTLTGEQLPI